MEYRIATKNDLQNIITLNKQLNPDEQIIDYDKALIIWDSIEKTQIIQYFIAVNGNEIVSMCCISIIPNLTRKGRPYSIIENVITDIKHRRQGIGKNVVLSAVEYAKKSNCYKVLLLSSIKRVEAHKFYEAIGFNGNSKKGFEIRFKETTPNN